MTKTTSSLSAIFNNKIITCGILCIFYIAVTWLASIFFWSADAPYFTNITDFDNQITHRSVKSLSDIMLTQGAYYLMHSGRIFCLTIVQLFCTLLPPAAFKIINGLFWIAFILLASRLAGFSISDFRRYLLATLLSFLIFIVIPLDPPFMINYLWMGCLNLLWLILFRNPTNRNSLAIVGLVIISLLAGNSHEGFSIPISASIFIILILRKLRLSRSQIWMVGAYWLGTLLNVTAPGNFIRLGGDMHGGLPLSVSIETSLTTLAVTAILAITFLCCKKNIASTRSDAFPMKTLLIGAMAFCLIFAIALKLNNLCRLLACFNIFLLIAILPQICSNAKLSIANTIIGLICIGTFISENRLYLENYEKFRLITERYHQSEDGVIKIPDQLFSHNDGGNNYYEEGWVIRERTDNPDRPELKILPYSIDTITINPNASGFSKINHNLWILVCNKKNPAKFVVSKTLLPSILSHEMSPRVIDLTAPDSEDVLLETDSCIIGCYVNRRGYIRSEVSME